MEKAIYSSILKFTLASIVFCVNYSLGSFNTSEKNIKLKKDLKIGTDQDGIYLSNYIRLEIDSKGKIYVVDWITKGFRVFDQNGELVEKIDRSGRGPGDFERPRTVSVDGEGKVYVFDSNLFRYTVFDSNNAYKKLETVSIPHLKSDTFERTGYRPSQMHVFHNNDYFLLDYTAPYSPGTSDLERNTKWVLFNDTGEIEKDPFLKLPSRETLVYDRRGNLVVGTLPFGKKPHFYLGDDDLIYTGWPDELNISIHNMDKELINTIEYPVERVEISSKDLEEPLERITSFPESVVRDQTPEYMPVYDWFVVDDKSRVWVAVNTEDRDHYKLLLFSTEGALLKSTTLSKSVELQAIKNNYAYGIYEGEFDVKSIIRFQIIEN